jgi:Domain of unknown function (DUF4440)
MLFLSAVTTMRAAPEKRAEARDREALIGLENEWLNHEHSAAELENILAPDFVHPVPSGYFLTKEQHIDYTSKHLPQGNFKKYFEQIQVRIYGDVGIVNGTVVMGDEYGKKVNKTVFTDVFAYRDGRWQAINAQENQVEGPPKSE